MKAICLNFTRSGIVLVVLTLALGSYDKLRASKSMLKRTLTLPDRLQTCPPIYLLPASALPEQEQPMRTPSVWTAPSGGRSGGSSGSAQVWVGRV